MGRSRSRSRDRDRRDRSRSRSRDRHRSRSKGWDQPGDAPVSDAMQQMQAIAALQQQQQLQRQILAQQSQQHQILIAAQQQQAMAAAAMAAALPPSSDFAMDAPPTATNKKQRELYVGNLQVGVVTNEMLRELFNALLINMVPDPITQPPVMEVKSDPSGSGRFAFVEFRTAALALAALQLDKTELAGRTLNIGRPKGYVEPPALEQQAKLSQAQQFAAQMSGGPTNVVLLDNLMDAPAIRDEEERRMLYDDVYAEASKFGTVTGLAIPVPPPHMPDSTTARVYIRFTTIDASKKCQVAMDGREFDDRKIKAVHVPDEVYYRSQANEWVMV